MKNLLKMTVLLVENVSPFFHHKVTKDFDTFLKVNKRKNKSTQQFLKIFDFYAFEDFNYFETELYHYLVRLLWLNFPVIQNGICEALCNEESLV
ncbi:hypothetical protein DRF68_10320 [Candidatus Chryseobacterium massiliae]|uniref:Uncharacterized protein n=2 Tax=Chryseobacterium group TaxID=2782232 RepID=A0A3D9B7Y4_9FLAO|nr:hypothetical protein DRF68_10320 [Candidatus Chryseobacterium massiliae]